MEHADALVAALRLPSAQILSRRVEPLPLAELRSEVRDSSLYCAIASVDDSGRVLDVGVVGAMGWEPGCRLESSIRGSFLLVARSLAGETVLSTKRRFVIPVGFRRRCGIVSNDRVLLAAAPACGFVLVHTMDTLGEMLVMHHLVMNGEVGGSGEPESGQ
jgi:hypothetical protein